MLLGRRIGLRRRRMGIIEVEEARRNALREEEYVGVQTWMASQCMGGVRNGDFTTDRVVYTMEVLETGPDTGMEALDDERRHSP